MNYKNCTGLYKLKTARIFIFSNHSEIVTDDFNFVLL